MQVVSLDVIFVAPSGDRASWWLDSPLRGDSQFETYVSEEVVRFTDSRYRTIADHTGRALIGSSMGGHGALTLLAKHPDVFGAAVSISGVTDLTRHPDEWDVAGVLGPLAANGERWKAHSFNSLAASLAGADRLVVLTCGTEDFTLEGNRATHALLDSLGIAHGYSEEPGGHTRDFVSARFGPLLGEVVAYLRARQAANTE